MLVGLKVIIIKISIMKLFKIEIKKQFKALTFKLDGQQSPIELSFFFLFTYLTSQTSSH